MTPAFLEALALRRRGVLELFLAANLTFLALDILFAHSVNSFRDPVEWLPLWFSLLGGGLLFGLLPLGRESRASRLLGGGVGFASIAVGLAGVVYHLQSPFLLGLTPESFVYAAPFAAPLSYAGIGGLLLLNRARRLPDAAWRLWVLRFAAGGFAVNFILALLDHEQNGFSEWTEWIPVAAAALAFTTLTAIGFGERPGLERFAAAVLAVQAGVGILGFALHLRADFGGPPDQAFEALVHGAPPFAPLLFADLALLGAIGLLPIPVHSQPPARR